MRQVTMHAAQYAFVQQATPQKAIDSWHHRWLTAKGVHLQSRVVLQCLKHGCLLILVMVTQRLCMRGMRHCHGKMIHRSGKAVAIKLAHTYAMKVECYNWNGKVSNGARAASAYYHSHIREIIATLSSTCTE